MKPLNVGEAAWQVNIVGIEMNIQIYRDPAENLNISGSCLKSKYINLLLNIQVYRAPAENLNISSSWPVEERAD